MIENIIDAELSVKQQESQGFFIAFYKPESKKQIKMCHYQAKNYEEACFILAKINVLRQEIYYYLFLKKIRIFNFKKTSKKEEKGREKLIFIDKNDA